MVTWMGWALYATGRWQRESSLGGSDHVQWGPATLAPRHTLGLRPVLVSLSSPPRLDPSVTCTTALSTTPLRTLKLRLQRLSSQADHGLRGQRRSLSHSWRFSQGGAWHVVEIPYGRVHKEMNESFRQMWLSYLNSSNLSSLTYSWGTQGHLLLLMDLRSCSAGSVPNSSLNKHLWEYHAQRLVE